MIVLISAGGKGTRISSVAADIPKPMIRVCGKPVLQHQMECLKRQGLTDITISISHLGSVIRTYFGDGSDFGVSIHYIEETDPLGTGGALGYFKDEAQPILLLNGDLMLDVDFGRMLRQHNEKRALATLLTHPNQHPFDSALIETDREGRITGWLHREETRGDYENRVNAGVHIIEPAVLSEMRIPQKLDLDRDLLKPMIGTGRLFAYDSPEYVKDMGTPERYRDVCRDCNAGIVHSRNLLEKQRAIFLDRDGTINRKKGFITRPEQIELLPGAADAIRFINESGYLAIVITNQPVIARGECTFDELNAIHMRLERLLGEQGAYLDDIFYCPHHPDKGFAGERPELKIECACRKPKPGLLFRAAEKYNINMSKSVMIGDEEKDVQAGTSAGCGRVFRVEASCGITAALVAQILKQETE